MLTLWSNDSWLAGSDAFSWKPCTAAHHFFYYDIPAKVYTESPGEPSDVEGKGKARGKVWQESEELNKETEA